MFVLLAAENGHTAAETSGQASTEVGESSNGIRGPQSVPLSAVVRDAVRRWFLDTHKEALRGDVVSNLVTALPTAADLFRRSAMALQY